MSARFTSTLSVDLAGGAALLAILAATAVLGVRPAIDARQNNRERAAQLTAIKAETSEVLTQIRALDTQTRRARSTAEQHQLHLLSKDELNTRIAQLIDATELHSLEVVSIQPGDEITGEIHARTVIDIAIRGALPDVVRYLHTMREETADLIVRELVIKPTGAEGAVTASISADWLTRAD